MPVDRVSNAELCAFLDGESGHAERLRIEHAIAEHSILAGRLATWRRNDAALRAAFPPAVALRSLESGDRDQPIGPLRAREATRRFQRTALTAFTSFIAGAVCATGAFLLLQLARAP